MILSVVAMDLDSVTYHQFSELYMAKILFFSLWKQQIPKHLNYLPQIQLLLEEKLIAM